MPANRVEVKIFGDEEPIPNKVNGEDTAPKKSRVEKILRKEVINHGPTPGCRECMFAMNGRHQHTQQGSLEVGF